MQSTPSRPTRRLDIFRWLVEHPGIIDSTVFGSIAIVAFIITLVAVDPYGGMQEPAAVMLWTFFMVLPGMAMRTHTGRATLAVGILAVGHMIAGQQVVPGDLMIFYALFSATAYARPWIARTALGASFFGLILQILCLINLDRSRHSSIFEVALVVLMFLVMGTSLIMSTWAVGKFQRAKLNQLLIAQERAEHAERDREQRAALAVAAERSRIAREMHDVVAHSLSVIIAQADGGRFIADQDPVKAANVLETIGQTGRHALADMRSLLGVLRQDEETTYGPQPDLSALSCLITRITDAGTRVELTVHGDLDDLPQALSLSAFRLVQEALTNVMKHAGPQASASVTINRTHLDLHVTVIDDGQGHDPQSDGQGHGLTGMRERVAVYDGSFVAGPLPGRGFRVSAHFPLQKEKAPRLPLPSWLAPARTRQGIEIHQGTPIKEKT
ncbi:sensor histidine kinase [Devriesea agamarum]|uniref:sensor histidine kinase n=1 Tax=Devriesea agamarum TaxID=472569 RepID=UPI00071C4A52|nr:sensor histidine kinase [Devriesea agamarum]